MATRWTCPRCESAVLGSTRPRRNDVCRYCLPCSEKTGKLVERSPLALEKRRTEREAKQRTRAERAIEQARAEETAYYTVGGIDLREVVAEAYRFSVAHEWRSRRNLPTRVPSLTVRRARTTSVYRRGFAAIDQHRIHVTVCVGADNDLTPEAPIGTLLHEVAHILTGRDRQERFHSVKFYACLSALKREYRERHPEFAPVPNAAPWLCENAETQNAESQSAETA